MNLQLEIDAFQLGEVDDLAALFSLDEQVLDAPITIKQGQALRHFSFSQQEFAKLGQLKLDADAIFVLLPESRLEPAKAQAYQELVEILPSLQQCKKVYLFPYGRCAMQLALRHALKLIQQRQVSDIQVLAYHQDPRLKPNSNIAATSSIASQCFMAVRLYAARTGLSVPWASYEVQTPDKSAVATIAALLQRYQVQCGEALTQCYLPISLEEELKAAWLTAFQCFSGCLNNRSQVVFADARVGDLAACSGLFKLCHMVTHYQRKEHTGVSFQLDISDKTYRSAFSKAQISQ